MRALAILAEAGVAPGDVLPGGGDGAWGVFAARAPGLAARREGDGWVLDGVKPWCSLGEQLPHALVTAGTPEGQRLFAVDLTDARVRGEDVERAVGVHRHGQRVELILVLDR